MNLPLFLRNGHKDATWNGNSGYGRIFVEKIQIYGAVTATYRSDYSRLLLRQPQAIVRGSFPKYTLDLASLLAGV
jgi:hypothetical protein